VWAVYLINYKFLLLEFYVQYTACIKLSSSKSEVLVSLGYTDIECTEEQLLSYLELFDVPLETPLQDVDFKTYYTYEGSGFLGFSFLAIISFLIISFV